MIYQYRESCDSARSRQIIDLHTSYKIMYMYKMILDRVSPVRRSRRMTRMTRRCSLDRLSGSSLSHLCEARECLRNLLNVGFKRAHLPHPRQLLL